MRNERRRHAYAVTHRWPSEEMIDFTSRASKMRAELIFSLDSLHHGTNNDDEAAPLRYRRGVRQREALYLFQIRSSDTGASSSSFSRLRRRWLTTPGNATPFSMPSKWHGYQYASYHRHAAGAGAAMSRIETPGRYAHGTPSTNRAAIMTALPALYANL